MPCDGVAARIRQCDQGSPPEITLRMSTLILPGLEKGRIGSCLHRTLEHHCASGLISSAVSIKPMQQYLGHKNGSEPLDSYGDLMPGDEDRVRAAFDTSLRQMCDEGEREARSEYVSPGQGRWQW
jgi:hypothetical protein